MAKGKSKKNPPAKDSDSAPSTEKGASIPRGVRKHLRELETQLSDAARKECKQLAKVERAARRRQAIDAKLDKLHSRIAPETQAPAPEDTETPVD